MDDSMAIDAATISELRESVGDEFMIELVDTFLEEAPSILAELRSALAASDAVGYRRAAHSLKSNGTIFGALTLAALARDAELNGFTDNPVSDAAALDALDAAYSIAATALKHLSRG